MSALDASGLQERLTTLIEQYGVPGAALGVLHDGQATVVAAGVLSTATTVEATPDSLFQIGSITKVWTATLVMQLVDEGVLDLDAPVRDVLPTFGVADDEVSRTVTPRHLLTHTSGIDGDVFTDTGRGDDCVARYVDGLADVAQNHPLAATWSYCNAGFIVLGRIVERLRDSTWDAALRTHLVTPLGLEHTVTLPEEALLHSTAVGHVAAPGEELAPAGVWTLPRSVGPAGLITASAGDVLRFADAHLRGGITADGTRVLSAESAAAMTRHEADLPERRTLGDSIGLAWLRYDWSGARLIGHDGNTIGQSAFLLIHPERRLAITLLTNGGKTRDLYTVLYAELFSELAEVSMPPPFTPPEAAPSFEPSRYTGRFERAGVTTEVFERDAGLALRTTVTGPLAALVPKPVEEFTLVPVEHDLFAIRAPDTETWIPVRFYALPDGARYVHFGVRANPRVADA